MSNASDDPALAQIESSLRTEDPGFVRWFEISTRPVQGGRWLSRAFAMITLTLTLAMRYRARRIPRVASLRSVAVRATRHGLTATATALVALVREGFTVEDRPGGPQRRRNHDPAVRPAHPR
jgi:hypothetical protein